MVNLALEPPAKVSRQESFCCCGAWCMCVYVRGGSSTQAFMCTELGPAGQECFALWPGTRQDLAIL